MEQDDELDEVGVCLLPEWLFAAAEEVLSNDAMLKARRMRPIVMKRVVAELRVETDLDVVLASSVAFQNLSYFPAKSPFTSRMKPPILCVGSSAL